MENFSLSPNTRVTKLEVLYLANRVFITFKTHFLSGNFALYV